MRKIFFEHYKLATILTAAIFVWAIIYGGPAAIFPIIVLAAIEISFSFDNAVVNSRVLAKMSHFWRIMYLTVGFTIAVFGVRALLPILLVSSAGDLPFGDVVNMALHHPKEYSHNLEAVYPVIAAFGGIFLMMVGLKFFGEKRKVHWFARVEKPLERLGNSWVLPLGVAGLVLLLLKFIIAPDDSRVFRAAMIGVVTYTVIKLVTELLMKFSKDSHGAGFVQFLYLEVLDASFSLDSVVAAFSISKDVFLIIAGLAIGAIYLRSMTLQFIKSGTLSDYRYLVHGAHYAIIGLSIILLLSVNYHIPEVVSGVVSVGVIGAAFVSSKKANRLSARKITT